MKTTYKNLFFIALSTLVCVFLAAPASAQRQSTSGGGTSGGSTGSSGGNTSVSRPPASNGGGNSGVAVSRPPASNGGGYRGSVGNVGVSRPPAPSQRVGMAPQTYNHPGSGLSYSPRQGVIQQRGNYGYAPRPGVAASNNYNYVRPGVSVNGNAPRMGYAPRGYTSGGTAYRNVPTIGYGKAGYWGNHGYYHYSHGYYGSYYLPRIGFTCAVLPYGYYPFYWGDYQYFYSDGLFYQYDNSQYTVVEPPIGAEVTTLPDKAQSIVINGQQYYELNGVYYQPVTKDDGTVVYMIAGKDGELNTNSVQDDQPQGPQMGDILTQLPPDCRKIKVNGEVLFASPDGIYYQQQVDANGNKTYKIVGLPSDEPESN